MIGIGMGMKTMKVRNVPAIRDMNYTGDPFIRFGNNLEEYELGEYLGKGGFGVVCRAKCRLSKIDVAIKKINKKFMESSGMWVRLNDEIAIHSRLQHPSILKLYRCFEDSESVFLVLELCDEGDMQKYLQNRPLVEEDASDVIRQVVDGMIYLHKNGILHRDITLSNLLMTADRKIKIADFGLATKLARPDEKHTTMCGTANYISPEVVIRTPYGHKAELWSLGILLFTMLVGRAPFDTKGGVKSTMTNIVMSALKLPPNLSKEAADLINSLLQKDPEKRINLESVLSHPFLSKYSSRTCLQESVVNITGKRWNSHDSGVASCQTSSISDSQTQNSHKQRSLSRQRSILPKPPVRTFSNNNVFTSCDSSSMHRHQFSNASSLQNHPFGEYYSYNSNTNYISRPESASDVHRDARHVQSPRKKVPPINSIRLRPRRERILGRSVTVFANILENGDVRLESIVKTKDGKDRIQEIFRITPDGLRIAIYEPNQGMGAPIGSTPDLEGTDVIMYSYDYENIPQKHWKKYAYASKFVELLKSRTPKITFYSPEAKCSFMENGPEPDFEARFYEGGKITKSSVSGIEIVDQDGETFKFEQSAVPKLPSSIQQMWEHCKDCLQYCYDVQTAMNQCSKNNTCFPLIIGRRPQKYAIK